MKQIPEELIRKTLESSGLEPEDKGDYFRFICPSCGKREAFIYKGKSLLICSRKEKCDYKKDIFNYIKEEGLIRKDILTEASKSDFRESFVKTSKEIEIPEGTSFFYEMDMNNLSVIAKKALRYLKKRKIPENNIYKLGYTYNPEGKFGFSIFIPFYEDGEIVYFITRSLENGLRYNNPKGVDGYEFVYNYDNIFQGDNVFIFEGVFDALSLESQTGTAMLTSTLSKKQASKILERAPKNIIFVPDRDDAGERFILKNINTILKYRPPSLDIDVFIYNIKNGKDFNEESINKDKHHIYLNECIKYKVNHPGITMKRKPLF